MEKTEYIWHNQEVCDFTGFLEISPMGKDKKEKPAKASAFRIGFDEAMPEEEAKRQVAEYMRKLEEEYKDVPPEELEASAEKMRAYLRGDIAWGDLFNFSIEALMEMTDFGYHQFKMGRYEDAERIFKVLTVLDWNNAYYHSMLGSILHRQKRYAEALTEYSQAIELSPNDIPSHTHRGEIYLMHGLLDKAKADLEKALSLDESDENKWVNRARILMQQLEKKQAAQKKD